MQKITPNIWLDDQAEEAANFYVSIFKDSKIKDIARYPGVGQEITGKEPGSVMTVALTIAGMDFVLLNGGPQFKLSEAVSFIIDCEDQAEVDDMWAKITADGGQESQCGWAKDKFGLSWQIVPRGMSELFTNPDKEKANKAMAAMLQMKKLDINKLREASEA